MGLYARVAAVCLVGSLSLVSILLRQDGVGYSNGFTGPKLQGLAETLAPSGSEAPTLPVAFWAVTPAPLNFSTITTGPSEKPTAFPSVKPTADPTPMPTLKPTEIPTPKPTEKPSPPPSEKPSAPPSRKPSQKPTGKPSNKPSQFPTIECKEGNCGAAKKEAQQLHQKADMAMAEVKTQVAKFNNQVTDLEKNAAKDMINFLMYKGGVRTDPGLEMIALAKSANSSLVETLELARTELLEERGRLDEAIASLEGQRSRLLLKRDAFNNMIKEHVQNETNKAETMGQQIRRVIERVTGVGGG